MRTKDLEDRARQFDLENPEVYRMVCRFANELITSGYTHAGIGLIWERMRWETMIRRIRPVNDFKLNNDFRAYYARKWLVEHPMYPGFFSLRTSPRKGRKGD